jgi:ABC-type sugar transport system permease subunit
MATGGRTLTPAWRASRLRRLGRAARAYFFLLPSGAILLLFVAYPIVQSFWMSLHTWSFFAPTHPYIGLRNYQTLLNDSRFWNALRNTAVYTGVVVPAQVSLGLALAVALRRTTLISAFLRSVFFFPVISSLATMGIVWKFLLNPQIGSIDAALTAIGLPGVDFLQSTTWALPAVMLVGVWKNVGFSMVIFLAALQDVPEPLLEAAALDGAGPFVRFWRVVLPLLRPSLLFAAIIATIGSMQLFDSVYVMTNGGPIFHTETLVTYLYEAAFQYFQAGYAAAISWVLFLLILALSVLQLRLLRYNDAD